MRTKRKWSGSVETNWSPSRGLFASGSAEEIALVLAENSDSYAQAVSRLFFYRNRAGRNLTRARARVLDKVHLILAEIDGRIIGESESRVRRRTGSWQA